MMLGRHIGVFTCMGSKSHRATKRSWRDTLLKEGHETHPGIVMKALTRSYIWWAGLDAEIEI